jgi:hypothetical protein
MVKHFQELSEMPLVVACTKRHFDIAKKTKELLITADEHRNIPWNKDGKNGSDDPENSQNILLNWLRTPGNYSKYRGHGGNGKNKKDIANEVTKLCLAAGTVKERLPIAVISKISGLEKMYRKASDFASNTGVGVLANDGKAKFNELVCTICRVHIASLA